MLVTVEMIGGNCSLLNYNREIIHILAGGLVALLSPFFSEL